MKELRHVKGRDLLANARNWRTHGGAQRQLMKGILQELGFVGAAIARELEDGTLELLDGHMRGDIAPDSDVPVLIVDIADDEVDKVLATFDPVGAMAGSNEDALRDLVSSIDADDADIRKFLDETAGKLDIPLDSSTEEVFDHDIPGMPLEPHEHYDYIVILCSTTQEWNVLCERLELGEVSHRGRRVGLGRAIRGRRLLRLLGDASQREIESQ